MKQHLKSTLIRSLALADAFPTRRTEPGELRALVESLHPWSADQALIRLGPAGDGGYLVPDDLAGISACLSPGVSFVSGFEKACADRGMNVFLADRSVDGPAEAHARFHFTKKFVGALANADFMTLDDWAEASVTEPDSDLLLQIDIEGYEYEVFLSASAALLRRFRIIVAEFHLLDQMWSKPFFGLARSTFGKILQTHACVHIHPNNGGGSIRAAGMEIPKVMEFTFLRNDRLRRRSRATRFPHPLDGDNTPLPSLPLPRCWYRAD